MTDSNETKLCRLCGCDGIENKNIFDESADLLIKIRTTFSLVVSISEDSSSFLVFLFIFIIDLWTLGGGHCHCFNICKQKC